MKTPPHPACFPALVAAILLLLDGPGLRAHEDDHTHASLSIGALLFLEQIAPEDGALFSTSARIIIRNGSINEDDSWFIHHFYNPKTGLNTHLGPSITTAPQRASDEFWTKAIDDFRGGRRDAAFGGLGHVLHLLQDMTSPAHVHNDPHLENPNPLSNCQDGDDFENWGWSDCSDHVLHNIPLYISSTNLTATLTTKLTDGLSRIFNNQPQRVSHTIGPDIAYSYIHTLADQVYNFTAFQVVLKDTGDPINNDRGTGELDEMFGVWEFLGLSGGWIFEDSQGYNIWSQGECGGNRGDQAWWLEGYGCSTPPCGPFEFNCTIDSGFAYIENTGGGNGSSTAIPDTLVPARYRRDWYIKRYGDDHNSVSRTMLQIYGDVLYPAAVAYGAGLLQAFLDEAIMPKPITQSATVLEGGNALLNGQANPGGVSATAWFEWGTSTAFGNQTLPQVIGSGANFLSVGHSISGLLPETTYHYRVVSSNQYGIRYGTNRTFRAMQVLWAVGLDDDDWTFNANNPGNGGGRNATFVIEANVNPLPGNPASPEVDRQADDDYYFAGLYTNVINSVRARYGPYTPVGRVSTNEEAVERAFAGDDNQLRYHFNLPNTAGPSDWVWVSFDAMGLDGPSAANPDPRYGVEVYFNGVLVQPEILIRAAQLGQTFSTRPFTLGSVNAAVGPGPDNIVTLRGINHRAEGGGNWMGIDYVQLNVSTNIPPAVFPWAVGLDDNAWTFNANNPGNGGGTNATFVVEANVNPLPGNPASPEVDQQADDDYYFAGLYTNVINSVVARYGPYTPVGLVSANEEAVERAFGRDDNELRYHFNLPNTVRPSNLVWVSFDALNLDDPPPANPDPRYGVEVYFNGVLVQTQIVIRAAQLGQTFSTRPFTLGSVNAAVGPGHDNIVTLRGINHRAEGGGNWMGIDYVQLNGSPTKEPLQVMAPVVSGGQITLNWTGAGTLESAPSITGPWTPFTPAPKSPYSEALTPGLMRFYRLRE